MILKSSCSSTWVFIIESSGCDSSPDQLQAEGFLMGPINISASA